MTNLLNTGTRDIPLKFAAALTDVVNRAWADKSLLRQVTPVTADLLRYWFEDVFCQERFRNFHIGQKQAILNTVYCHEVLKAANVFDLYAAIGEQTGEDILDAGFLPTLQKDKYAFPKYCVKMATGTGKTWVLNALLIWQYLNAKYGEQTERKYTKNFLVVAPGLIVYDRLLDAFKGKLTPSGARDFYSADIVQNADLFLPERYREAVFSLLQNAVCEKRDIGRKVTGEGIIAVTNWHLLSGDEDDKEDTVGISSSALENGRSIVKDLLPITPGTTAGHDLNSIDRRVLNGGELEYLVSLPDICVFNDEAHHIHENKTDGIVSDVEWQEAMNKISSGKGRKFVQIDFSATPYDVTGSGQRRTKHYFPHVIVDFALKTAVKSGLVKAIALDKRKEIASLENSEIDFKAVRDGRKVVALSEGQRLMLRAGLSKLRILEEHFTDFDSSKYPKMLVICEDTSVTPFVEDFLKTEGLEDDDVMTIDSNKKGQIAPAEWDTVKRRLFNLDGNTKPKVIVSVLMLREGFDVSNVCVIVPLRSSEAPILLEQVIGRGLRLMWRDKEYEDIKRENLVNLYEKKAPPANYLDILSIVEHPAFERFYEDLDKDIVIEDTSERANRESVLGDLITVGLKENFADYDLFWPVILHEKEEIMADMEIPVSSLRPLQTHRLEQLQKMMAAAGAETFYSKDMMVQTNYGEYRVKADLFTAQTYNDFLQKLLTVICGNINRFGADGRGKPLPLMAMNQAVLVRTIDKYIRTRLFDCPFDPMQGNNWRVMILSKANIVEHIMREFSRAVYEMQNNVDVTEAVVLKEWFSQIDKISMRENFALALVKTIYEKTAYPSNRGGLEKDFMIACDEDTGVERFVKINENKHTFAHLRYLRTDGMLSSYYPDFLVKCGDEIFVVETKSDAASANDANVLQKHRGALDWTAQINALSGKDRMNAEWKYALLDETTFYGWKRNGATIREILSFAALKKASVTELLDL